MKPLTESQRKARAKAHFKDHPNRTLVFMSSDGQCFHPENLGPAKSHARTLGDRELYPFEQSEKVRANRKQTDEQSDETTEDQTA